MQVTRTSQDVHDKKITTFTKTNLKEFMEIRDEEKVFYNSMIKISSDCDKRSIEKIIPTGSKLPTLSVTPSERLFSIKIE